MQHSPMCSNCDLSQSEYICDICQTHYCSEFYQTIHAARALQTHQKISINQKLSEIRLCNTHKDKKLKYWCEECHIPVCSDCLLIEHKDHTYNLINKTDKTSGNEGLQLIFQIIIYFFLFRLKQI
jgi:hypothetical protein